MRFLKHLQRKWHVYILWLLLSFFLWSWIFTFITDTKPSKKVTLFFDTYICNDVDLTLKLEENKPKGARMIKVHPFSYAMFMSDTIQDGDIFVVGESKIKDYIVDFCPISDEYVAANRNLEFYTNDEGVAYGVKVYDAQSGKGCITDYLVYCGEDEENEDYYLFFHKNSLHIKDFNGSSNNWAIEVAENIFYLGGYYVKGESA